MSRPVEILLIEDREEDAFLIQKELARHIPNVKCTRIETLEQLNQSLGKNWDIVLCDFNLPEFDGLTALNMLRQTGSQVPFILVSGLVEEGIAVNMMRLGANDYIMKENLKRLGPAVLRELKDLKPAPVEKHEPVVTQHEVAGEKPGKAMRSGSSDEGKHTELLEFIEQHRQEEGLGPFIAERHRAVVNIIYLANLIKKHQDKILERQGLTDTQFNILRVLKRHSPKPVSINEVKEQILNKTSDVSRIIDRMVKQGVLHSAQSDLDKRVRNISIAEAGNTLLLEMNKLAEEMFLPADFLNEEDAKIVNEKLKKLIDEIE